MMSKLSRHLRNPRAIPKLIWKNIIFPFTPQAAELRYDRQLGIDTCGLIQPDELGVTRAGGRAYMGTPPKIAEYLIGRMFPRAEGFTFIDIGSGKGRVLLVASRFAFRRVIGFEYSADLNAVAAENIRRFAQQHPNMAPVELMTGDATKLPLPNEPLVIFLFNPLDEKPMADFATALRVSYQCNPRKIIVIYYNALFRNEFLRSGIFSHHTLVPTPVDPTDRYTGLRMPTFVFETP